jgi:hypothetical protein
VINRGADGVRIYDGGIRGVSTWGTDASIKDVDLPSVVSEAPH